MKKISKRTRITKFTPLFRILRKSYGSLTEVFSNLIFIFFLFPFTNVKGNMLTQGFRKFYGSITEAAEAPKTIFQKRGGACRPVASSLSNPTSKMFRKGLDSNCYLHPYLDKFTPLFVFLAVFFPKRYRTLRITQRHPFSFWNVAKHYGLCNNALFDFRNLRNLTDCATMLLFDFRNVAELYGLPNDGC